MKVHTSLTLIAALMSTVAMGNVHYMQCGFESPAYQLGDLNGQNGWIVGPNCGAMVQDYQVFEGSQALALTAAGSLGGAYVPLSMDLSGGFASSAAIAPDETWFGGNVNIGGNSGYVNLSATNAQGASISIQYGMKWGPFQVATGVPVMGYAPFALVTVNGTVAASAMGPVVLYIPINEYHTYSFAYSNGSAVLTMDGNQVAQMPLNLGTCTLQGLSLVSVRPLVSRQFVGTMYFDELSVSTNIPTPNN